MSEEITLEEVLRLVSFENFDGEWAVKDVRGDVGGSVLGDANKPTTPGEDVK